MRTNQIARPLYEDCITTSEGVYIPVRGMVIINCYGRHGMVEATGMVYNLSKYPITQVPTAIVRYKLERHLAMRGV